MIFQWDKGKAETNMKKHGVRFVDAVMVFDDDFSLTIEDDAAEGELIWLTLGMTDEGCLVVVWTERIGDEVRIISARNATRHEKKYYQKRR
ncbi:MAG: BrnT family toxin [Mariprofundaceae bacterium]